MQKLAKTKQFIFYKIIRHFKEAASEAVDEFGTDDFDFPVNKNNFKKYKM